MNRYTHTLVPHGKAEATCYDAVIVGARCAGAATALLLARQGLRVLAIDRARYGSDTLSTHALMRGGVLQLHRWGVLPAIAAVTPPVRTTTFHYDEDVVSIPIKARGGVEALYAPRRTVLDRQLVDAARLVGAEVRHQVALVDLLRDETGRVRGATLRDEAGRLTRVHAGITIGADGLRSRVAADVGAATYHAGSHATGTIYALWEGLGIEGFHWHFSRGVSAGAIPTNDGLACVFVSIDARRFRDVVRGGVERAYHQLLGEGAPALAASLGSARREGGFHGFPGQPGLFRRSHGSGWALVGDAGYFKDPTTAHGITDALRDAELLAAAVVKGTDAALADYQTARDDLARGVFEVTDRIASFEWNLDELKVLHGRLSEEVARETAALAELGPVGRERPVAGQETAA